MLDAHISTGPSLIGNQTSRCTSNRPRGRDPWVNPHYIPTVAVGTFTVVPLLDIYIYQYYPACQDIKKDLLVRVSF
ncbi:unnamed protein product [Arctogadus glacialis]